MTTNATKVDLYLKSPSGLPLTNTRVAVKPVRAGFWSDYVGLVEDTEVLFETDINGYVQMTLWPLPYPYFLTYSYDDNATPGEFLFYVPAVDYAVRFQDLIVTQATPSDTYADTVLEQIIAAKVAAVEAAAESATSATASAASATAANASATSAASDALETTNDRNQVAITNQQLIDIYTSIQAAVVMLQAFNLTNILKLGLYSIWVDGSGRLRIMNGTPTDKNTDGTIVGTQS